MDSKGTQPYIYTYAFSPKFPSHPGCHITLNRVPCAIHCWLSILNIAVCTCPSKGLSVEQGNSAQCYVAAWMGGEFEGECIHVYLWLSLCGSLEPVTTLFVNQLCAVLCLVAQSRPTLHDPMDCSPPGSSLHGDSPAKNTGVGCHALLQSIFLI